MSSPDQLPEDQRTVLALLVGRGMSYQRAGAVLGVSADAVRDRAHVALAMLAPAQARELDAAERAQVADYMLGQESEDEQLQAREMMASSPAASSWGHALSRELEHFAPAGGEAAEKEPQAPAVAPGAPVSRRGGAMLLAGAAVIAAIAIVLVIVLSGGSGNGGSGTASGTNASHSSTKKPEIIGCATLTSSEDAHRAGEVFLLQEGSRRAYYIAAVGLPPTTGFFYAVWLYNTTTEAKPLNRTPSVGSNGRLTGGALLPKDAESFHEIILTRETQTSPAPTTPGPTVLGGKLNFTHSPKACLNS